jgi:hypothetical protein
MVGGLPEVSRPLRQCLSRVLDSVVAVAADGHHLAMPAPTAWGIGPLLDLPFLLSCLLVVPKLNKYLQKSLNVQCSNKWTCVTDWWGACVALLPPLLESAHRCCVLLSTSSHWLQESACLVTSCPNGVEGEGGVIECPLCSTLTT